MSVQIGWKNLISAAATLLVVANVSFNLLAPSHSYAQDTQKETVVFLGDSNYAPYEFIKDGKPAGANVDLLNAIGKILGKPFEIRLMNWAEAQKQAQEGKGRVLTLMSKNEERLKLYDFTEPTFAPTFSFFVKAESASSFDIKTLSNKRIGVHPAGFPNAFLTKNHPEAAYVLIENDWDGFGKLLRGEIDAVATSEWVGYHTLKEHDLSSISSVHPPFAKKIASIAVPKGNPDLVRQLNQAIRELKQGGDFARIVDKWSGKKVILLEQSQVWFIATVGVIIFILVISTIVIALTVRSRNRAHLMANTLRDSNTKLQNEINERQQVEGNLRDSEARLRRIVEYSPTPMAIVNMLGNIEHFNAKFVELFGWTTDDIRTPDEWWNAAYPNLAYRSEVREEWEAAVAKAEEMEQQIEPQYWRLTCKNGDVREIEFQMTPLGDLNVIAMTDLTKRIHAEKEIIQHRNNLEKLVSERTTEVQEKALQLEQALESEKKFSSLQRKFISLVSHEFRTPLTIIDGTAQRMVRSKKALTPEFLRERSEKIRTAVGRMTDLIENTLYAANLEEGVIEMHLESMDLCAMLRDLATMHGEIAPDHDIAVDVDSLAQSITADEKLLGIVFTNLLSNAIKFAPAHSSIEVKGWTEGHHAVVSVADHGVGIPENELPHMFERFFRAKTAEGIKGTGIGLNVSKEFVEMHGGEISVDSAEGEGSTFTVRLPISGED